MKFVNLRTTTAVVAILSAAGALVETQSTPRALTVWVTAAPLPRADEQVRKQHEATLAAAAAKLTDLEKALKAQHGNKRDRWPADAQELYRQTEDAATLAGRNHLYSQTDPEDLAGSVEDVKKGLAGAGLRSRKGNVILVESPADAELIIELKGRRSARGSGGLFGRHHFVLFVVKRGQQLSAEQFAAIHRTYRRGDKALFPIPHADASEWTFEAFGSGSWKVAGSELSSLVDRFISANYDVLLGEPRR